MLNKILIKENDDFYKFEKLIKDRFPNQEIFISQGWIDSHVHLYSKAIYKYTDETYSHFNGVVLAIDAGSLGVNNFNDAKKEFENKPFDTFFLINVASDGLLTRDELNKPYFDIDKLHEIAKEEKVIGYKMRYSSQAIGSDNTSYKEILEKIQILKLPIMYHIGNEPPMLAPLLKKIKKRKNDFITHIFHNKNSLLIDFIDSKESNDINFDVGFGNESFSFITFDKLNKKGFKPTTLSTDIHSLSIKNPTCILSEIMSLFLENNFSLEEVVEMTTINPYNKFLKETNFEYFKTFTAFKIEQHARNSTDSSGNTKKIIKKIVPIGTWRKGEGVFYE